MFYSCLYTEKHDILSRSTPIGHIFVRRGEKCRVVNKQNGIIQYKILKTGKIKSEFYDNR